PIVEKTKGFVLPPRRAAIMVSASTLPWRKACCAVGGQDFPVVRSGTAAQSPSAHRPGQSATSRYSFTARRPRSFLHSRPCKSGLGDVPAVQTSVLVSIIVPSLNLTPRSETPSTFVLTR